MQSMTAKTTIRIAGALALLLGATVPCSAGGWGWGWGWGGGYSSYYGPSTYYASYAPAYYSSYYGPSYYSAGYRSYGCSSCGYRSCGLGSCGYGSCGYGCQPCGSSCSPCGLACAPCGVGGCATGDCNIGGTTTGGSPAAPAKSGSSGPPADGTSTFAPGSEDGNWRGTRDREKSSPPPDNFGSTDASSLGDEPPTPDPGAGSTDVDEFGERESLKLPGEIVVPQRKPESTDTAPASSGDEKSDVVEEKPNADAGDDTRTEDATEDATPTADDGQAQRSLRRLEHRITWRSSPVRTRLMLRSKLSLPAVARQIPYRNVGWSAVSVNGFERR